MENNSLNKRAARILGSLDGLQKADAPDFFYTRLQGKMQNRQEEKPFFLLRPAFITAVLSVFLIINVFSLVEIKKSLNHDATVQNNKPATIESFAKAYNMSTASVYE